MMRKATQDRSVRVACPIPPDLLPAAAALWWAHFGMGPRRARFRGDRGVVAVDEAGRVLGVAGLRDAGGGFAPQGAGLLTPLFRAAPPTADLVIDGIAVARPRQGVGAQLLMAAMAQARAHARPGLRAEVRAANGAARAFYAALGFEEEGRGRYGLPWWGQVVILRRDAA